MSVSAFEGGAVFEGESQAAIRIGRGIIQQAAPRLFGRRHCENNEDVSRLVQRLSRLPRRQRLLQIG